jgi:hypothetical protein
VGLAGLRAVDVILSATAVTVVSGLEGDSKISNPSASTCSNEDPGVASGDPLLSLSVEHYSIRGSDDMLEEAYLGVITSQDRQRLSSCLTCYDSLINCKIAKTIRIHR